MTKHVNTLVKRYVQAQNSGDFTLFKSLFSPEVLQEVNEEKFLSSQKTIQGEAGKITASSYITSLKKSGHVLLLFKVGFDGSTDDYILTIVVKSEKKSDKALGIWLN